MSTRTLPHIAASQARPRLIALWLFAVAALVFIMVVVGGITRLTESGLSIVRWNPIGGMIPPLNAAQWLDTFAAYQTSPQGRLINAGMSLAAFKGIFFWEWLHRLIGMSFSIVFALPLAIFLLRRWVPAGYTRRLLVVFALGAFQGVLGWWMVASGLVDLPAVAHERLAAHLVNALVLMSVCLWTALDLLILPPSNSFLLPSHFWEGPGVGVRDALTGRLAPPPPSPLPEMGGGAATRPTAWIIPFTLLLAMQIIWGAFTAGLRAGHASDTWPLMFGRLVPPGLASLVDDPVSVQFVHRSLAWLVAGSALWVAVRLYRAGAGPRALAIGGLVLVQFALGVSTVVYGVPIALAAAHQAGAALLLAATVVAAHWSVQGHVRPEPSLQGATA